MKIPDDVEHIGAFWGALSALTKRYSWGKPLTADSSIVSEYWEALYYLNRENFECVAMANKGCGCCPDRIFRYNSAGQYQYSDDQGETWVDSAADPRAQGTVFPTPAWLPIGDDNRCAAMESTILSLKSINDHFCDDATYDTVEAMISALVTILGWFMGGPVGVAIVTVIQVVALALWELGQFALCAAMDSFDWDALRPILYCNMNDDGTYTPAQIEQIKSEVAAGYAGDHEFFMWNVIHILGAVGMSNAARAFNPGTVDCSDIGCDPCGVQGVYYVVTDVPRVLAKAEEISPNVVRLHSYVPNGIPNGQYIAWQFGTDAQGQNCCRTLGYQNLQPPTTEPSQAHEIRCDNVDASHLWPWLGVEVCGYGGYITGFNIAPYTIDLRLAPDEGCP